MPLADPAVSIGSITNNASYQRVSKFGRATIGTTFSPICFQVTTDGPVYRTPTPSNAAFLRVAAGNADDAQGGTGARTVFIQGILQDGSVAEEILQTNGTSAGPWSKNKYMRLFRSYVQDSGTYAIQDAGSHAGDIEIEGSDGNNWLKIDANEFPRAQSEVGAFTVPLGKNCYIERFNFSADANKLVELVFFQCRGILDETAPFRPMRIVFSVSSLNNQADRIFNPLLGPFPECTDLGVMAKVASTTNEVHVDFELILIDNE